MRGQRHAPAAPYPRKRPGTHCTGGWVGLTAGLDWCGKSRPTGIRAPDRPARRQSLYRLRYPAHSTQNLMSPMSNFMNIRLVGGRINTRGLKDGRTVITRRCERTSCYNDCCALLSEAFRQWERYE